MHGLYRVIVSVMGESIAAEQNWHKAKQILHPSLILCVLCRNVFCITAERTHFHEKHCCCSLDTV